MPSKIPIRFLDEDEPADGPALGDRAPEQSAPAKADEATAAWPQPIGHNTFDEEVILPPVVGEPTADERPAVVFEDDECAAAPEVSAESVSAEIDSADFEPVAVDLSLDDFDPAVETIDPRALAVRLERVEAELAMVDAERQELAERLTRVQADFDNVRKRNERERTRTFQGIVCDVARELLPVLDNLQRALEAEASFQASESEEFRHFLHGVELIYRQLEEIMKNLGLRQIETTGLPFDPHVHEAVAMEHSDQHEPETVTQEIARGYLIGDQLLRPALVKVSTK